MLAFSATAELYCFGSNTGLLSFSSRIFTFISVCVDRGGSPRSRAVTISLYDDCSSRSRRPEMRSKPSTGPNENGTDGSPARMYSMYPFRPSSLSIALIAITIVFNGVFSRTFVSLDDVNSGDISFTSFNCTDTCKM